MACGSKATSSSRVVRIGVTLAGMGHDHGEEEAGRHLLEFVVCSGIAQSVEQAAVNRKVQGSSPCPGANFVCKFG